MGRIKRAQLSIRKLRREGRRNVAPQWVEESGGALRGLSPAQMMKERRLFRLFSTLPRLTEFTDLREGQRMGASGERGNSSHPQRTPGSMSPGYAHVGGDRQ